MMSFILYSALVFLIFFNENLGKRPDDPLKGAHSVCVDVCTPSDAHVELDLSEPKISRDHEYVQINLHHTGSGRCREPALLRIPLNTIGQHGIIKFDLHFGPVLHNFSIDIGFDDESTSMKRSFNIFNQQVSIEYRSNGSDLFEQSVTLLEPGEDLIVYLSNEWIHIENKQRQEQKLTIYLNETNFFFSTENRSHLLVGFNRNINGNQTGIGVCRVNLTFIECIAEQQSALDIDVNNKTFEQRDLENINWISHLTYLDPNDEARECTAQGVIRLTFDPLGVRRIARFDLTMGSQIQGFTFNFGDSSTNNGYGGDGGTTSNSAEIHSNDNRFYIWANTKICGDTLLLKIDYNVIEPGDIITILISNERIELTNHRSYHQILRSPYLFALNQQNVTCNCFDSLCYPGVQPDNDIYFGLNRVIGGTYRPGTGVCNANINWLQCKKINVSPRITHVPATTATLVEQSTTMTSTEAIELETNSFEHTNEMTVNTTSTSTMEITHQIDDNNFNSTFASQSLTTTESNIDHTTIIESTDSTQEIYSNTEQPTSTVQSRLFNLLVNSTQYLTTEYPITEILNSTFAENLTTIPTTTTTTGTRSNSNPCTVENLRANLIYHEYPLDAQKFIFCDTEGKMNIIACSPTYIWSQRELSCILPV